jgi:hypothetical protein
MEMIKEQKQKPENVEIKFSRNVAKHTLKDQIRNIAIRNELNIFSFSDRIWNNLCKWNYHTERMESENIPKQLMNYIPRGTRSTRCSE